MDREQAKPYRNYAAHTVQGVAKGVRQLGELFRWCVAEGFFDDNQVFLHLKAQREEWRKNYALETQLEQARKISEQAWREKDYAKVMEVLGPFESHLSGSELKKLEFVRSRLR
ncbi:MAG: hypothetical protein GKR87_05485 [Kiritimatiellae bacterium]|nr:hypothetical protein [Kiritimatiellia bacterium]